MTTPAPSPSPPNPLLSPITRLEFYLILGSMLGLRVAAPMVPAVAHILGFP